MMAEKLRMSSSDQPTIRAVVAAYVMASLRDAPHKLTSEELDQAAGGRAKLANLGGLMPPFGMDDGSIARRQHDPSVAPSRF